MAIISAAGLFCIDKFEDNQTRKCSTFFRMSKLTKPYFNLSYSYGNHETDVFFGNLSDVKKLHEQFPNRKQYFNDLRDTEEYYENIDQVMQNYNTNYQIGNYSMEVGEWTEEDEWEKYCEDNSLHELFEKDFQLKLNVKTGQVGDLSIYHVFETDMDWAYARLFFNNEEKLVAALFF